MDQTRALRSVQSVHLVALLASISLPDLAQNVDRASQIYSDSSKTVFLLVIKSPQGESIAQGSGFLVANRKIVTNEHVARAGSVFIDLKAAARVPQRYI